MLKSAWAGYELLPLHLHPGPDLNQKSDVSFGQIFHLPSSFTLPEHSSVFYIHQMAYNGMQMLLSPTLCFRHHMAYNGMQPHSALFLIPMMVQ